MQRARREAIRAEDRAGERREQRCRERMLDRDPARLVALEAARARPEPRTPPPVVTRWFIPAEEYVARLAKLRRDGVRFKPSRKHSLRWRYRPATPDEQRHRRGTMLGRFLGARGVRAAG